MYSDLHSSQPIPPFTPITFDDDTTLQDNIPIGDTLNPDKPHNHTRLFVHNVDGFVLADSMGGTYNMSLGHTQAIEADLIGFCDHKINTHHPASMNKIRQANRRRYSYTKFTSGTSPNPGRRKWGGTMALAVESTSSRVIRWANGCLPA